MILRLIKCPILTYPAMKDCRHVFWNGWQYVCFKRGQNSHIPAFEVLGVPNYPFVRVMAMDNYRRSHWSMINEAPELMFLFGEKVDRNFPKILSR